MYIIDSHCHLDEDRLYENWREFVANAQEQGVKKCIAVLSEFKNLGRLEEIISHPDIYGVAGMHPHEADLYTPEIENTLRNYIQKHSENICALGEIGLDFHYDLSEKEAQINAFRSQLLLAQELNLPVVIHTRKAEDETIAILEETDSFRKLKILFHCYTNSQHFLDKVLQYPEVYFSFSGIITFKNGGDLRNQLKQIPLANILIETDSPYLAPIPHRGKLNQPAYVTEVAKTVARELEIELPRLVQIVTTNTKRFFNRFQAGTDLTTVYAYKGNLYLNITNYCGRACPFCIRKCSFINDSDLFLEKNPEMEDILEKIREYNLSDYKEIVFCGFGDPLIKYEMVIEIAKALKEKEDITVRVNTNGLANVFNQKNIIPYLLSWVDKMNISLNASDEEEYRKVMGNPQTERAYYDEIVSFTKEAIQYFGSERITVSCVRSSDVDYERFKTTAHGLGVEAIIR